jgi:hypothetical protein
MMVRSWPRAGIGALCVLLGCGAMARAQAAADGICSINPMQIRVGVRESGQASDCNADTIQAAINVAASAGDCPVLIHVTREHLWTNQHLNISGNNRHIVLQGWGDGVTCTQIKQACPPLGCAPASDAALLTIDGSNAGGRVLTISGENTFVRLSNLMIRGGFAGSGDGGGIAFDGSGILRLNATTVSLNNAGYGGGINMHGSAGGARLDLEHDTFILNNAATTSGGGIRIEGNARLFALQPNVWIGYNVAHDGYGGGIEVLGPARADIGSPGYNGIGVVSYNSAVDGGGVAVMAGAGDHQDAALRLFTTDTSRPVQVSSNSASARGGALFLQADVSSTTAGSSGNACLFDYRLSDNTAPDGAAIHVSSDDAAIGGAVGNTLAFNTNPFGICTVPEAPPALGAVACAAGVPCNRIDGNSTIDANGQPVAGGSILTFGIETRAFGERVALRDNDATWLVRLERSDDDPAGLDLANCLVAGNHTSQELFRLNGESGHTYPLRLALDNCTIVGNTIDDGYVFNVNEAEFSLRDSLVDQPGIDTLDHVGDAADLDVEYVLSRETQTLPDDVSILTFGDARYVDAANGDYRLQDDSPALDYAPARGGTDLDRRPRTVEIGAHPNFFGPLDLGAYELQAHFACDPGDDVLFCSGFDAE